MGHDSANPSPVQGGRVHAEAPSQCCDRIDRSARPRHRVAHARLVIAHGSPISTSLNPPAVDLKAPVERYRETAPPGRTAAATCPHRRAGSWVCVRSQAEPRPWLGGWGPRQSEDVTERAFVAWVSGAFLAKSRLASMRER